MQENKEIHILDVTGLLCPLPVIKAKRILKQLSCGDLLLVKTTDPVAQIDIPHMCKQLHHTLIEINTFQGGHTFLIRKEL
jgi:tRNA 2-thiouridine synthesizing protein A